MGMPINSTSIISHNNWKNEQDESAENEKIISHGSHARYDSAPWTADLCVNKPNKNKLNEENGNRHRRSRRRRRIRMRDSLL
jgi:hypothetical protein